MTTPPSPSVVHYSRGVNKFDNTPVQHTVADFDAFEEAILADRSNAKGQTYFCGPLSLGPHDRPVDHPGDSHYRLASHRLPRRFLALDHDGFRDLQTFEEIYRYLSRFRGFGYTTWSHTDQAPRARAVFELSREVNREEGIALGKTFDALIAQAYGADAATSDKCVHMNEQPVYSPGPDARIFHFDGSPLDVDDLLSRFPTTTTSPHETNHSIDRTEGGYPYARLAADSLVQVLGLIDCTEEPTWWAVALAIARSYGEGGRDYFMRFSAGEFWGEPYADFNATEVDDKYERALQEVVDRPGYGVRHLIRLSGLRYEQLEFVDPRQSTGTSIPPTSLALQFPCVNDRGRPLQVSENLAAVLAANNVSVQYNLMAKRCEVVVPNLSCVLDESSNTALTYVTDLAVKAGMTTARIPEMIDALASEHPFCPVRTYIESQPWDGISRLPKFMGQLKLARQDFARILIRKWLTQAVAAVYEPNGIASAGVLTLLGPQGVGKTTFAKRLASGVPGSFLEGHILNPAEKDSVFTAVGHWITELGELDSTFRKSDLAHLKAFLTKQRDKHRRPYARKDSEYPRRTVFIGTVNDYEFLHDPTGNRRFWPIEVLSIDRDVNVDYQQLWAEVKTMYDAGEKWYLDANELQQLERYSEDFVATDPIVEVLLSKYEWEGCTEWEPTPMKEIFSTCFLTEPKKAETMRLAAAIRKHNGGQAPRRSNGIKHHFVPAQRRYSTSPIKAVSAGGTSGTSGTSLATFLSQWDEDAG